MLSVGVDLVEINRIKKSLKNPRFCGRVFGKTEFSQLETRGFPVQSVAANFCAKEAFSKALGTGIRGFSLCEVELLRNELGKPYFLLSGKALALARERRLRFQVSVTHTREYAAAFVVAEEVAMDESSEL